MPAVQPTEILWKLLKMCGIDKNKFIKWRLIIFMILSLYFIIQTFTCIIIRWNEASRYFAMEDFEYSLVGLWFMLDMYFKPSHILTMLELIDNEHFMYKGINLSKEKRILIETSTNQLYKVVWIMFYLNVAHVAANCVAPLFLTIYKISLYRFVGTIEIQISNDTENHDYDLPLPYENWLPFRLNDPFIYLSVYSIHLFYGQFAYFCCSSIMLASPVAVLRRLTTDIQLLNISVKEINTMFNNKHRLFVNYNDQNDINTNDISRGDQINLHNYQNQLIENHKIIIRNVRRANEAIAVISLAINQAAAVFGCLSLYKAIEMEAITDRIRNFLLFVVSVVITFSYCLSGQRMQNEDERLRKALAEFNWINKPKWFRKNHLFMLTRCNKTMEIKPYGLYTLNYDNFSNIMRAAYTFCNVLLSVRKK